MGDDVAWWTAFGALAQAGGAVATFLAVVISLRLARAERGLHGRGQARIMIALPGDGSLGEYQLHFELENTGLRPLLWESTSWRVGWSRWAPEALRYQWAMQSNAVGSPFTTQTIAPAMTGRVCIPVGIMKRGLDDAAERASFFGRRVPLLGVAPITAFAHVAGRPAIKLKVSNEVAEFLRTGEHDELYEVAG